MFSLSPTLAKQAAIALETVARAPLAPIVNRDIPRNLSALPPSIRALPVDLQVVALADMLADARKVIFAQAIELKLATLGRKTAEAFIADWAKQ